MTESRFTGLVPESWCCIDCGWNTAPGMKNRQEMDDAAAAFGDKWETEGSIPNTMTWDSEVYTVRRRVWEEAGAAEMGGCLCIGCLEKRLGRKLRPKDFLRNHAFNLPGVPASERLRKRQGR